MLTYTLVALAASGCGAMLSGTSQRVRLEVSPPGTSIVVYRWSGEVVAGPGASPGILTVHRPPYGQPYLVVATRDGHCPEYWITSTRISPGGWGTVLVFNGVVPLMIDQSTGGLYSIEPSTFAGSLPSDNTCAE
jgi:hypothetical protein